MKVQNMSIQDVKPYENNPRDNDGGVDAVANSIKEFGWQQPIVVDKDNVIIVGHTRYKAAKKLGLKEVPVVIASNLSDEQVKAYRLADNKTGELTDWDFGMLNSELTELSNIDMTEFGFDESDLDLASSWDDAGSLDDYEEPESQNGGVDEEEFCCPKCGYKAEKSEFQQ